MARVDEVTQRNAAAAEEMASTAEELASQAASEQQLIAYFRLDGAERTLLPAAEPASGFPEAGLKPGRLATPRHPLSAPNPFLSIN
jgi:methyl-accepting chemotaxis protein